MTPDSVTATHDLVSSTDKISNTFDHSVSTRLK